MTKYIIITEMNPAAGSVMQDIYGGIGFIRYFQNSPSIYKTSGLAMSLASCSEKYRYLYDAKTQQAYDKDTGEPIVPEYKLGEPLKEEGLVGGMRLFVCVAATISWAPLSSRTYLSYRIRGRASAGLSTRCEPRNTVRTDTVSVFTKFCKRKSGNSERKFDF